MNEDILKLLKDRYFLENENEWKDLVNRQSEENEYIHDELLNMDYISSSPTLMNLNTKGQRRGTLSSCFPMNVEDSIENIFDSLKECALVTKAGGGVGLDFSNLRSSKEMIKSLNRISSGPLPFIDNFNTMLDGIRQGGVRRGAGMAMLSIYHPDILEFIRYKKDRNKCNRFNFTVRIDDEDFYINLLNDPDKIHQVKLKNNQWIDLEDNGKKVTIKELWNAIMYYAWENAEPGIFNYFTAYENCSVKNLSDKVLANPCLTGDTIIATADGRNNITIKQLVDEGVDVPVYTLNHSGNVIVKNLINPRLTQKNADIYKVLFDSGLEIKCTANHKFLNTDGIMINAIDLNPNDTIETVEKSLLNVMSSPIKEEIEQSEEIILKHCENCGKGFHVKKENRHITFCSSECLDTYVKKPYNLITTGFFANEIYKVVSVEYIGKEDVYDGTVEDTHTILIRNENYNWIVTGQCSEFVNIPYSSCNLGSLNLNNFFKDNTINYKKLEDATKKATRFLNYVIDNNEYVLPIIDKTTKAIRPIGLGIMGLAHLFFKLKIGYGTEQSAIITEDICSFITLNSMKESIQIAKEKGSSYPAFDYDVFVNANKRFFDKEEFKLLLPDIKKYGIYNSCFTVIAPTGSISFIADTSSGIEPVFSLSFTRKIEKLNKNYEEVYIVDPIFKEYINNTYSEDVVKKILLEVTNNNGSCQKSEILTKEEKEIFKTANDLSIAEHLNVLAAVANNISLSVSKCVAKGTKIQTNKGIFNIEDLGDAKGNDNFGAPIKDLKVIDKDGNWQNVISHYSGGKKKTKKILFNNGFELECSLNHKLLNSKNEWIMAKDLKEGDYVYCRSADYSIFNSGNLKIDNNFSFKTNSRKIILPNKMSADLALFLGMIAADGSLMESTGFVGITTADDLVEETFKNLCIKLFNIEPKIIYDKRSKNTRHAYLTSRSLFRYVKNLLKGNNCLSKDVPIQIINGSKEEQINFINGLTLNGYVSRNSLYLYEGYSKNLRDNIFNICCFLGLKPNKGCKKVKNGRLSKISYYVRINENFFTPIELHKQKEIVETNIIPIPEKIKDMKRKDFIDLYNKKINHSYKSFNTRRNKNKDSMRSNSKILKKIDYDTAVYFIKIKNIEDSENFLYDIEVENTHSYLISNIISHNTINFPNDAKLEDINNCYIEAYKRGIIGVTIYREGCREGILVNSKTSERVAPKRPKELEADIHKVTINGEKWIVFVGLFENIPYEVFAGKIEQINIPSKINKCMIVKNGGGKYHIKIDDEIIVEDLNYVFKNEVYEGITRLISYGLRHNLISNTPLSFMIDQLSKSKGDLMNFEKSISRALKKYVKNDSVSSIKCSCGNNLIYIEGCLKCPVCGLSKCS